MRLIQGHSGPHAPPVIEEEIKEVARENHDDGQFQSANPGSYARIPSWNKVSLAPGADLEVKLFAQPYLLDSEHYCQTLISCLDVDAQTGFAIVQRKSKFEMIIGTGESIETFQSQFPVNRWRWIHFHLKISKEEITSKIEQLNRLAEQTPAPETLTHTLRSPMILGSNVLLFGAGMFQSIDQQSSKASCFFNGRLDSPSFATSGSVIASYDFSQNITSDSIIDVSGNNHHGSLVNAPTRAVKGHDWDGSEPDWTKAKYGYGAIHFHEDDLDDANWPTNFTVAIPSTARSGAYAIEIKSLESTGERDMVTFFVRPNEKSTARVALVMTTFTYLAYANERMFDQSRSSAMITPDRVNVASDNHYFANLDKRPDLGLSVYDVHKDGSPCAYSSARRPILNVRPGYVHWALDRPREFSADLIMVGFLEKLGIQYDIITDHCLHTQGQKALSKFDTVITGCHPEYHSLETLDAFSGFAKTGGNLMYLGGNGFYWVAEVDSAGGSRLEVRKGDQGCRSVTFPAGERMHALNGVQGGLWRSRGRAPNYLFGVGPCAFGTGKGKPYMVNEQHARNPRFSWIFDGIDLNGLIGEHGFGGGASGDEIDRLDYELGSPTHTFVLATSEQHDDSFGLFNEDSMFPMVNTLGSQCDRVRSDMVYYE